MDIITRQEKGSKLTIEEMDNNLIVLKDSIVELSAITASGSTGGGGDVTQSSGVDSISLYSDVLSPMFYISEDEFLDNWEFMYKTGNAAPNVYVKAILSPDGKYQFFLPHIDSWSDMEIKASYDYGNTWTGVTFDTRVEHIAISLSGKYQTYVYDNIYVSDDFGRTFVEIPSNEYPSEVIMSYDGKYQTVFYYDHVVVSDDYGKSWEEVSSLVGIEYVGGDMSYDGKYQVLTSYDDYIYVSTDYGKTWSANTNVPTLGWNKVSISYDGKYQIVSVDGLSPLYISSDYGQTWQTTSSTGYFRDVGISYDGKYQVTADTNGNGFLVSTDYGKSWEVRGTGRRVSESMAMSLNGKYLLVLGVPTSGIIDGIYHYKSVSPTSYHGKLSFDEQIKISSGNTHEEGEIRYKDKQLWLNTGGTSSSWSPVGGTNYYSLYSYRVTDATISNYNFVDTGLEIDILGVAAIYKVEFFLEYSITTNSNGNYPVFKFVIDGLSGSSMNLNKGSDYSVTFNDEFSGKTDTNIDLSIIGSGVFISSTVPGNLKLQVKFVSGGLGINEYIYLHKGSYVTMTLIDSFNESGSGASSGTVNSSTVTTIEISEQNI